MGVTNDLRRRVAQHRSGRGGRFTRRYRVHRLVYAEEYGSPMDAIAREKQIKAWSRRKKKALIDSVNPGWREQVAEAPPE